MQKIIFRILLIVLPLTTLAQTDPLPPPPPPPVAGTTIRDIIRTAQGLLDFIIPSLIVLATIVFIWGVIWYISSSGKEDKQKEARNIMVWGIIILFVIVAVWGLVEIIGRTFSIENSAIPENALELRVN